MDGHEAYVISFTSLKSYGHLPCQGTEGTLSSLTKLSEINKEESLIIFVTHRGVYQSDESRPSIDTEQHDKYNLLCEAVEKVRTLLVPGVKECYLWIDCVCSEVDEKDGGISSSGSSGSSGSFTPPLEVIMASSDLLLTPMYDASVANIDEVPNAEDPYEARPWGYGPEAYLARGWCRLEMLCSLVLPLEITSVKKRACYHESFEYVLNRESRGRPHLLYGSYESKLDLPPLVLPEQEVMFFDGYHPFKGKFSRNQDRLLVKFQMERLRKTLISKGEGVYQPFKHLFEVEDTVGTADSTQSLSFNADNVALMEVTQLPDGSMYRGAWKAGKKHGKGALQSANGDIYDGNFEYDEYHGMGIIWYKDGDRYEGNFETGHYQGHGMYVYQDGDVYEGAFVQGVREGHGRLQFSDGSYYTGSFENDAVQGKGSLVNPDGSTYEGDFVNGVFEGYGSFKASDGSTYVGEYKGGIMNGNGLYKFANGDTYEGAFKDGMSHGKGIYKSIFGDVYEGFYRYDKRHGKGKLRTAMGSTFVGHWEHGQRTQKCVIS